MLTKTTVIPINLFKNGIIRVFSHYTVEVFSAFELQMWGKKSFCKILFRYLEIIPKCDGNRKDVHVKTIADKFIWSLDLHLHVIKQLDN